MRRIERDFPRVLPAMRQHPAPGDLARPGKKARLVAQLTIRLHDSDADVLQDVLRVGVMPNAGEDVAIQRAAVLQEQPRHLSLSQGGPRHAGVRSARYAAATIAIWW